MPRRLNESNPYLRDEVAFERAVHRSVATSSAIDGITAPFAATWTRAKKGPARKTGRSKPKANLR